MSASRSMDYRYTTEACAPVLCLKCPRTGVVIGQSLKSKVALRSWSGSQ